MIRIANGVVAPGINDIASDTDNTWTDGAVGDAHIYTGWTYDYFYKRFNRRGLDNADIPILNVVHPVRRQDFFRLFDIVPGFFLNAGYYGDGLMVYGVGLPAGTMLVGGRTVDFFSGALEGTVATAYAPGSSPSLEGGVSVRVWRRVGFGLAASRLSASDGPARVEARIPHPFFDEQHRAVSGQSGRVSRTETAVHVQVTYTVEPPGPLAIVFSAGPSFVSAGQTLVSGVRYADSYPYETATFLGVDSQRISHSAAGFNAGGEAIWMLGRRFGVGGILRY